MVIGDRLRELRDAKKFSQGDIEKKTGLLRCYISRVENGHTVPSLETLEKLARALEVPMYRLFYDGERPAAPPNLSQARTAADTLWGHSGKQAVNFAKLRRCLGKSSEADRKLLMALAQKVANRGIRAARSSD
jgi:transcriptional regulator with XRE-family HTH domain